MASSSSASVNPGSTEQQTLLRVLLALSFSHLLNDTIQSLIPAIYPLLKASFQLTFAQIGLITFAFQGTASLLQPLVGIYTDRRPQPYSLAIGMGITLVGLVLLSRAASFPLLLLASALVGTGSSIFHPEASRLARLARPAESTASPNRCFKWAGISAARSGRCSRPWWWCRMAEGNVIWFSLVALLGIAVLTKIGGWYRRTLAQRASRPTVAPYPASVPAATPPDDLRAGGAGGADLLEVHLPGEPHELLYLLSDQPLPGLSIATRAQYLPVLFPLRRRRRHDHRRTAGRSLRPQVRDLDFHPWRRAVHPRAAVREPAV